MKNPLLALLAKLPPLADMIESPFGKLIHTDYDAHGPIQVFDDGHKRYLTFGNDDEQSCQLKHAPHVLQHEYSRGMLLSLALCEPQNIAIIGLGGGTLITALDKHDAALTIFGVELRKAVLNIAYKYFQMPRRQNIHIAVQDGCEYLQNCAPQSFDILIADMYISTGLNPLQLAEEFIALCHRAIREDGWLVLNYWLDHQDEDGSLQALKSRFRHLYGCDTGGGNWLVFASNQVADVQVDKKKMQAIAAKLGFSLQGFAKRLKPISV
jgi:spermidine synthase